jgi:hypothetical protein
MGATPDYNRFSLPDNLSQDWLFNVGDAISFGDLMYDNGSDVARPADKMTTLATEVLDQEQFAVKFIGVAQQQILASELNATKRLTIRTDCVCDFTCPSQTWNKGDLVGIYSNGTTLDPQQVDLAGQPGQSIGVVVKYYGVATTRVRVRIFDRKTLDILDTIQSGALGDQQNVGVTTMADADTILTVGSKIIQKMTPTAARAVTLPALAQSKGFWFYINNLATSFAITVKNPAAATIGVVSGGFTGLFFCDGATWYSIIGSNTAGSGTATTIAGSADPLALNGLAAAQGGAVTATGGTSSTSANAGGAVNLVGGLPGLTGVGGAVNITGAIGGATSGAGGALVFTGGAGTAGNAAGGAASLIGGLGQGSAAGGAITITSGAAGATGVAGAVNISVGAATAGAGSNLTLTGGNGAGGTAAGGNVNLIPGTAVSTGVPGEVTVNTAAGLFEANWQQFLGASVPVSGTSYPLFLANRACRVKAVRVVCSSTATVPTVDVTKDTGTTAPGGGSTVLTGPISFNTTANTVVAGTLIATVATLTLAAGDRLSAKWAGTVGSITGAVISVLLVPV